MVAISQDRGNRIIFKDDKWFYSDTGLSVEKAHKDIPCGNCGEKSTEEGHDACLGTLIGVMNACCGHGKIEEPYIQFWDKTCIRGKDALTIIEVLKKYR